MNRYSNGVLLHNGRKITAKEGIPAGEIQAARRQTIADGILRAHHQGAGENVSRLNIRFDAMASHDITYVGIIQTARASGLSEFPLPYVLTNCHNSLCAVGGTINEDDHLFGLSAAKKYGGIFVPAHQSVIHQYMREMMAGCGKMILGSDSHTRYGAIGTMAIGEGGPELVKQLLRDTYDIAYPDIVAIYLDGEPAPGVGPQDVALSIIREVFRDGFVKNCVMEFVGPGVSKLSMDFRIGIDVMTTETTCLSSIWETDEATREYLAIHGREEEYRSMAPGELAYYEKLLYVNLSEVKPMIALPFHPSNAFPIEEVSRNAGDILSQTERDIARQFPGLSLHLTDSLVDGRLMVEQGVIAGCAGGGFENLAAAARILDGTSVGSGEFALSVYPASQPVMMELMKNGSLAKLMAAGATVRTAFCGPCFGAGDVPANGGLSIRHSTRNFPNREGSKPGEGQLSGVALMDARSIAATAANGGRLTSAQEIKFQDAPPAYYFDRSAYDSRCYFGFDHPQPEQELRMGPNIADWPEQPSLGKHVLLKVCAVIEDEVTTTDELIPSGETSSYRSNPMRLAQFTLSRKDPEYVTRAVQFQEQARMDGTALRTLPVWDTVMDLLGAETGDLELGSVIYARKPGDGSAREQAASCQRVLGGLANLAMEYATKRYRSNLINWGMLPLRALAPVSLQNGDFLLLVNVRTILLEGGSALTAVILRGDGTREELSVTVDELTQEERSILLKGCLISYNRARAKLGE